MNFLQARRQGGTFVLRMEDTDQGRSTPESVQAILDGLNWLGIDWDEGPGKEGPYAPYFQMQRLDTYRKHADQLIAEGKAYRCYCTKEDLDAQRQVAEKAGGAFKYPGTCRERTEPPPDATPRTPSSASRCPRVTVPCPSPTRRWAPSPRRTATWMTGS